MERKKAFALCIAKMGKEEMQKRMRKTMQNVGKGILSIGGLMLIGAWLFGRR